jgi:hypothetical protein
LEFPILTNHEFVLLFPKTNRQSESAATTTNNNKPPNSIVISNHNDNVTQYEVFANESMGFSYIQILCFSLDHDAVAEVVVDDDDDDVDGHRR